LRDYGTQNEVIWDGNKNCEHEWVNKERWLHRGTTQSKIESKTTDNLCIKCGAWKGQLGLEPTPQLYINHLVDGLKILKKKLKKTGSLYLNLGDTYFGSGTGQKLDHKGKMTEGQFISAVGANEVRNKCESDGKWLQPKQLMLMPARVAIALQEDGWLLRNDVIWYKSNSMPSCLDPKTKVFVNRNKINQIEIKDIQIGDLILSPTGWKKIKNKWVTKQELFLFQYGSTGNILCGKNHKFPISHDNRRINYSLEEISKIKEDNQRSQRLLFKPIRDFLNKEENEEDYEIGKFFGLIVAEGGFNSAGNQGKITLHKKEIKLMEWFISVLKNRYKQKAILHKQVNNYRYCQFSSKIVKELYKSICLGKCKDKKLNREKILNSSYSYRKGLFDGIIIGDGYIDKNGRIIYGTASNQLRNDVGLLASSLGYLYSRHGQIRLDKRTNKKYCGFFLTIPLSLQKEFIKGETTRKNGFNKRIKQVIPREYKNVFSSKTIKFKKIWESKEQMEMVDIEVEDGLFLVEDGLVSHNSVKDRLNTTYEHIFHFVKNRKYYYDLDAIREPHSQESLDDLNRRKFMRFIVSKDVKTAQKGLKVGDGGDRLNRTRDEFFNEKGKNPGDVISPFGHQNPNRVGRDYKDPEQSALAKEEWFSGEHENNPFGKNPGDMVVGDFWSINTQPFPAAHFAVFSEEICIKPIKSSCPKEICKKCGFIRERIVEVKGSPRDRTKGKQYNIKFQSGISNCLGDKLRKWKEKHPDKFLGYSNCNCNVGFKPGIVLDPFTGSGTTLLVAKNLKRNFIGFELNPKYIKIAEMRLKGCQGWQLKEAEKSKSLNDY